MRDLNFNEVIDVMVKAAYYQAEVYKLYRLDIIEITKYKYSLDFELHYDPSEITYEQLYSLFRQYFSDYKRFISKDDCYSHFLTINEYIAHFEIKFHA